MTDSFSNVLNFDDIVVDSEGRQWKYYNNTYDSTYCFTRNDFESGSFRFDEITHNGERPVKKQDKL